MWACGNAGLLEENQGIPDNNRYQVSTYENNIYDATNGYSNTVYNRPHGFIINHEENDYSKLRLAHRGINNLNVLGVQEHNGHIVDNVESEYSNQDNQGYINQDNEARNHHHRSHDAENEIDYYVSIFLEVTSLSIFLTNFQGTSKI